MTVAKPLVSIVVNNYNYARYVGAAIESALSQTLTETEVVVVDDGSTDDSRAVIEGYGDRIRRVYKKNGGQGSAYNAGFAAARGEYVCFLDADDTLFPNAMAKASAEFESSGVVKVQWPLLIADADGRLTGQTSMRTPAPEGDLRERVIRDGPLYDFEYTTGSCYRRGMLREVLPVPEQSFVNGADVFLITLAPIYGRIHTVGEPLGTYRWHRGNNYQGRTIDLGRLRNFLQRFDANCAALQRALKAQGVQVDAQLWRDTNFNYLWPARLIRAVADLDVVVPSGATAIVIGSEEWGMVDPAPGRHIIPFGDDAGKGAGVPADDDAAIDQLELLRQQTRATHLVYWWTSFWWFDHYPKFAAYVRQHFGSVLENDGLVIFDLREIDA